eukprot:Platyproteum_vivax@DN5849_c0_g1_i1.p1
MEEEDLYETISTEGLEDSHRQDKFRINQGCIGEWGFTSHHQEVSAKDLLGFVFIEDAAARAARMEDRAKNQDDVVTEYLADTEHYMGSALHDMILRYSKHGLLAHPNDIRKMGEFGDGYDMEDDFIDDSEVMPDYAFSDAFDDESIFSDDSDSSFDAAPPLESMLDFELKKYAKIKEEIVESEEEIDEPGSDEEIALWQRKAQKDEMPPDVEEWFREVDKLLDSVDMHLHTKTITKELETLRVVLLKNDTWRACAEVGVRQLSKEQKTFLRDVVLHSIQDLIRYSSSRFWHVWEDLRIFHLLQSAASAENFVFEMAKQEDMKNVLLSMLPYVRDYETDLIPQAPLKWKRLLDGWAGVFDVLKKQWKDLEGHAVYKDRQDLIEKAKSFQYYAAYRLRGVYPNLPPADTEGAQLGFSHLRGLLEVWGESIEAIPLAYDIDMSDREEDRAMESKSATKSKKRNKKEASSEEEGGESADNEAKEEAEEEEEVPEQTKKETKKKKSQRGEVIQIFSEPKTQKGLRPGAGSKEGPPRGREGFE